MVPPLNRRQDAGTGIRSADPLARTLLAAALVLGSCRFLALGEWSLWLDEAYTLADSRHGNTIANPLGYLLFGGLYDLVGGRPTEYVLRLPAALLGWLALPLAAWALRPLVGRRGAAVVALVLAVSPWHVYWSQNARFYTLAQALGLVGGGFVYRGLVAHRAWTVLAGVGVLGGAALVHPSAAILAGAFLAGPWIALRSGAWPEAVPPRASRAWQVLGLCLAAAVIAGSPWAYSVWQTWEQRQGQGDPAHFVLSTGYLLTPFVGLGVLCGVLALRRLEARRGRALLVIVGCVLGATLAVSFFVRVSAQYVFVALPWIIGLAALPFAARRVDASLPKTLKLYLAVLVLPLAAETGLYFSVRHGDRPRWKEAYAFVFEHREPTDLLLGMEAEVGEYYLNPTSDDLRHWQAVILLDRWHALLPGEWMRYRRRMWLVVNHEQLLDWLPHHRVQIQRILAEECQVAAEFRVPYTPRDLDVVVYLYEPEV